MKHFDTWRADSIRFAVSGRGAQHFLSAAAARCVRLENIRCTGTGYEATAAGADAAILRELAVKGGWELTVRSRRGPGRFVERLLARPGVPAGAALFLVLVRFLTGFVWAVDFGGVEPETIPVLRQLLAEQEIWEGAWLTKEKLNAARNALSAQSGLFGWTSLNFTGGCLTLESAPAEFRQVQPRPSARSLTAKAGGEVLSVEVESGFALVKPGQYVAEGQELAVSQKLDRNGTPVTQAVQGRVTARVTARYSAEIPLQQTISMLTGRRQEQTTLHLLGTTRQSEEPSFFSDGITQTEWLPLTAGRLAVPGCRCRVTRWELAEQTVFRSAETALALARRDCRRQLNEQFPDAIIEEQQMAQECDGEIARCTVQYVFAADVAKEEG